MPDLLAREEVQHVLNGQHVYARLCEQGMDKSEARACDERVEQILSPHLYPEDDDRYDEQALVR